LRIDLKFCSIEWTDWGCLTRFPDGAGVGAHPHEIPHYYVISHRCGYGDDTMAYCREHEFAHAFVAERLRGGPSYVLLAMAHREAVDKGAAVYEEIAAQTFQRWLRANERPILWGADWDGLKRDALSLLAGD
jgi:hypothetical protein